MDRAVQREYRPRNCRRRRAVRTRCVRYDGHPARRGIVDDHHDSNGISCISGNPASSDLCAGVELYGCQMAMDMFKLERVDLLPQVKDVISAMDFIDLTEDAQIILV